MPSPYCIYPYQPLCIYLLSGAAVVEEMAFQTQRSNVLPRTHMPSLVKSLSPLKTSTASDLGSSFGSPFTSPALNRKPGILDLNSPWHGSVQSPHIMRRGPKLWTSSSGGGHWKHWLNCADSFGSYWLCRDFYFFFLNRLGFSYRSANKWFLPAILPNGLCCKSWS